MWDPSVILYTTLVISLVEIGANIVPKKEKGCPEEVKTIYSGYNPYKAACGWLNRCYQNMWCTNGYCECGYANMAWSEDYCECRIKANERGCENNSFCVDKSYCNDDGTGMDKICTCCDDTQPPSDNGTCPGAVCSAMVGNQ